MISSARGIDSAMPRHLLRLLAGGVLALAVATGTAVPASPASAAPPTPIFGAEIDGYAAYDPQKTCDPSPKPGVTGLRDILNSAYGRHDSGIGYPCGPGVSEHKEGRALDYMLNYANPAQRSQAEDIVNWLLATDRHGNRHANARRLGIMYLIWNRRIWGSYRAASDGDGWRPYTGSNPHTDHIHLSFSWPGARKQTTWWTASPGIEHSRLIRRCSRGGPARRQPRRLTRHTR
jgi:hypothetical protein